MAIKFIDLYSGNDPFKPEKIMADGYTGVIFKAGQGSWADCPRYRKDWWQRAKDAGLLVGWYWLCDSRYHSSMHIHEMEAWKIFNDVGQLGLWVDMEKPMIAMTETTYWKTPYAGYKNVVDFVYLLHGKGINPGIYTGPGAYELIMRGAPKSAHDYLAQHKLWTAQYPYVYIPGISKPKLYGSWQAWEFWQYQEGPDINIFNGTDQQFYLSYGGYVSPNPPPEPPVIIPPVGATPMYKGVAKQAPVNVKPMDGSSTLAQLQLGWYVYGDYSATRTDIINVTAYYKGNETAKVTLAKPCKVTASALNITEVIVTPPPPVPDDTNPIARMVLIYENGTVDEYKVVDVD
jgi:GH25 family lysozyme M1 (1,4-beta-N-acetylmuramidase)